jgi:hypothetical protein
METYMMDTEESHQGGKQEERGGGCSRGCTRYIGVAQLPFRFAVGPTDS